MRRVSSLLFCAHLHYCEIRRAYNPASISEMPVADANIPHCSCGVIGKSPAPQAIRIWMPEANLPRSRRSKSLRGQNIIHRLI